MRVVVDDSLLNKLELVSFVCDENALEIAFRSYAVIVAHLAQETQEALGEVNLLQSKQGAIHPLNKSFLSYKEEYGKADSVSVVEEGRIYVGELRVLHKSFGEDVPAHNFEDVFRGGGLERFVLQIFSESQVKVSLKNSHMLIICRK